MSRTSAMANQRRRRLPCADRQEDDTAAGGGDAVHLSIAPPGAPRMPTYYTLVFCDTKNKMTHDAAHVFQERVTYMEAVEVLRTVTAGGKECEDAVAAEFRVAWMAKFRTPPPVPHDTVPLVCFRELVRELMIERFSAIEGLQLLSAQTADGSFLVLSFHPSPTLLCIVADQHGLRIPIVPEADLTRVCAGRDPSQHRNGSHEIPRDEAQEALYRLFLQGKISPRDAQIFDQEGDRENAAAWSRRVRVLQLGGDPDRVRKFADVKASSALQTMHVPFTKRESLRYLYRVIDGDDDPDERGDDFDPATASLFRVVDKIRLTKHLIDAQFDCDALVEHGLLALHFCTHTHSTDAVDTSIEELQRRWADPLSVWHCNDGDGATITDGPYQDQEGMMTPNVLRAVKPRAPPHKEQPLVHVRNYFGEEIALYFAYASFYSSALLWLCVSGLLLSLLPFMASMTGLPSLESRWLSIAFAGALSVFLPMFLRKWELRERLLAAQWGVDSHGDGNGDSEAYGVVDAVRPQFRGQLRLSPITHRMETYYPPHLRSLKRSASLALLLSLCVILVAVAYALTCWSVATAVTLQSMTHLRATHLLLAVVPRLITAQLAALCRALTCWENYRSHHAYDTNLTLKFAFVQTVNRLASLWLLTFVRPFVAGDTACQRHDEKHPEGVAMDCSAQAAHLLLTILALDVVLSVWELRYALMHGIRVRLARVSAFAVSAPTPQERAHLLPSTNTNTTIHANANASASSNANKSGARRCPQALDAERVLPVYDGVMFDYAQLVVPLGLVAWFAALAPLRAPLLAAIVVGLQRRIDAFTLCMHTQRPFPHVAHSIGSWATYLRVVCAGAWVHNALLTSLLFHGTDRTAVAFLGNLLLFRGLGSGDEDEDDDTTSRRLAVETQTLSMFAALGLLSWLASVRDHADRSLLTRLHGHAERLALLARTYLDGYHDAALVLMASVPRGRVFLNGIHAYVVTGDHVDKATADELRREQNDLDHDLQAVNKCIAQMAPGTVAGVVHVEIGNVNVLSTTAAANTLMQVRLEQYEPEAPPAAAEEAATATAARSGHAKGKSTATTMGYRKKRTETHTIHMLDSSLSPSFHLLSLEEGALLVIDVFDARLGVKRRLGSAELRVADVVTVTPPWMEAEVTDELKKELGLLERKPRSPRLMRSPSMASTTLMTSPLGRFNLPLEVPAAVIRGMLSELTRHSHPTLALRCGVQWEQLGRLQYYRQQLQHRARRVEDKLKRFAVWHG